MWMRKTEQWTLTSGSEKLHDTHLQGLLALAYSIPETPKYRITLLITTWQSNITQKLNSMLKENRNSPSGHPRCRACFFNRPSEFTQVKITQLFMPHKLAPEWTTLKKYLATICFMSVLHIFPIHYSFKLSLKEEFLFPKWTSIHGKEIYISVVSKNNHEYDFCHN